MSFRVEFVVRMQITSVGYAVSIFATSISMAMEFVYFAVKHYADFVIDIMQSQVVQYAVELFATNVASK